MSLPLPSSSREELIAWLTQADPDGDYTDDRSVPQGLGPLSLEDLWDAVNSLVRDDGFGGCCPLCGQRDLRLRCRRLRLRLRLEQRRANRLTGQDQVLALEDALGSAMDALEDLGDLS